MPVIHRGHPGDDRASRLSELFVNNGRQYGPTESRRTFYGSSSNPERDQRIAACHPRHHESRGDRSIRSASALTLHEVPVPKPGPHEVLIAIETAGIGSWDASIRDGSWRKPGRPRFPLVPGVDGAGVVVAKGARVRRFHLGDRVYAYEFGNRQGGFYAEFAAARRRARGSCRRRARPARCRSGCHHRLDRTPGHRRARSCGRDTPC